MSKGSFLYEGIMKGGLLDKNSEYYDKELDDAINEYREFVITQFPTVFASMFIQAANMVKEKNNMEDKEKIK